MRTRHEELDPTIQDALLNSLLEAGAEPGSYVVVPLNELVHQMAFALEDTKTKNKKTGAYVYRPAIAATRLTMTLSILGWIKKVPQ